MNIREFRNNFCKLAEGNEIVTVTKRNQIIGIYTPKKIKKCERFKFNKSECLNVGNQEIKVNYGDKSIEARLCLNCLNDLKSNLTSDMILEEI